ncbi:3-oxoacyl-ACP synthase III [Desulfuromonas thiophila]|uniref:3-oxoacyl-[acyl-carrier-protein] synthase-3 n=1 Tax=Desulfuromonas thiophila TaxID=57664 RepID=A0A1G7B9C1_9BACT|nr:3-oxoacyl-ACP synthase III [Desulfuromonas thiophila]MDD3802385.1 3-oxoacyl-ACP synthase III [Desulfuromonas thiophila]SDE23430.1 3-oxoacyl-[acyl-carrier-protein] synthase-3 [Desulfuromonas thiophila]
MIYRNVFLHQPGYELAPVVVRSRDLEQQLAPLYQKLRLQPGQLEALTGIRERRWWHPGTALSSGAIAAGRKALQAAGIAPADIGALVYTGVCRELFEPATACRVADGLAIGGQTEIYDLSNACLGVLSGILDVANRIELGQIRAGLVVSCESARELNETTLRRLCQQPDMAQFSRSVATLTGGSGAVALLLTDGSFNLPCQHRLVGGVVRARPQHHALCRWGVEETAPDQLQQFMQTDAVAVMQHGVALGQETWRDFLPELSWQAQQVDRVICHQVGAAHQQEILRSLDIVPEKDFATFPFLGNIGTVSLPLTAALAAERGHLQPGQKVALLGIGSGLNCMMLGVLW